MIILGFILLVIAVLAVLAMVFGNNFDITAGGHDLSVFGLSISHVSASTLFLAGLITGFVGLLGLVLLFSGSRRRVRKGKQRRAEMKDAKQEQRRLAEENERLAQQTPASTGTSKSPSNGAPPTSAADQPTATDPPQPRT